MNVAKNTVVNFLEEQQQIRLTIDQIFYRSSSSQMFFKIGALKNLTIFSGKHLSWNLFLIKFQALRPATLLKIRDSSFLVNIEKFLSYSKLFLQNASGGCFCFFGNEKSYPRAKYLSITIILALSRAICFQRLYIEKSYFKEYAEFLLLCNSISLKFSMQMQSFADVIFKIGILKDFANFTRKHLYWGLF